MAKVEWCYWAVFYLDENKWNCLTDCKKEVIMTRTNKYWKLYKATLEPHLSGTILGVKCPFCGKELEFYDPNSD